MKSETYDPWRIVLLERDPRVPHLEINDTFIPGAAKIIDYQPNRVICQVESPNPGFLVLADNWHPDWQAFVDGERTEVYVANHAFRAVHVDGGGHEVVFKYMSKGFNLGRVISIIAFLFALGIGIISLKYRI